MTAPEPVAYLRDASTVNRPDVHAPKKMHLPGPDGVTSACGRSTLDPDGTSMPAAETPDHLRCRRPGCRALWPKEAPE